MKWIHIASRIGGQSAGRAFAGEAIRMSRSQGAFGWVVLAGLVAAGMVVLVPLLLLVVAAVLVGLIVSAVVSLVVQVIVAVQGGWAWLTGRGAGSFSSSTGGDGRRNVRVVHRP